MKTVTISVIIGLLALFYVNTAIVVGEGGGNSILVFRPFHGLLPFYGGGEEGSWRRAHPGQPDPWWHTGAFTRLASVNDEATSSGGSVAYSFGYYITVLGIIALIPYFLVCNAHWKNGST